MFTWPLGALHEDETLGSFCGVTVGGFKGCRFMEPDGGHRKKPEFSGRGSYFEATRQRLLGLRCHKGPDS